MSLRTFPVLRMPLYRRKSASCPTIKEHMKAAKYGRADRKPFCNNNNGFKDVMGVNTKFHFAGSSKSICRKNILSNQLSDVPEIHAFQNGHLQI